MGFHSKPTTFVGHVKIKVENLERSLTFYREVLGLDILEQTSSAARLTTDGKTSILSLEQPENVIAKQGRATGLYHFAILLPERSDLADIVVHLIDKGIRFGASDHLVSEALYLDDPDGNGIEIYSDRDPSTWKWEGNNVAMTTIRLDIENLLTCAKSGKAWKGMPEGTVMGHIHLHVADLDQAEEFYIKGLGLDVVSRFAGQALFMSDEKYHHHVAVNVWSGVGAPRPAENSVGLESFTLVYADEEARQAAINQLQQIGASVLKEENEWITQDPSGNRVVLAI
ncbi:VOC family protein [Niallia sp. XMNu-256]|uniref:VOC family protein n=1 Tax=Niallia sp. XMNu-256 TaxID=3082444 RepID=UPI0030D525B8